MARQLDVPGLKALGLSPADIYRWDSNSGGGGGSGDVTGPSLATDGNLAVFDGTTGKAIKDGGNPGGGGSFLSTNVARVDPSGSDDTGTIGDLTKPFLTVQAAITAFESSPVASGTSPVIILPEGISESVSTVLPILTLVGSHVPASIGGENNPALNVTNTNDTDTPVVMNLVNCSLNDVSLAGNNAGIVTINLQNANVAGTISVSTAGAMDIIGFGNLAYSQGSLSNFINKITSQIATVGIENVLLGTFEGTGTCELDATSSMINGQVKAVGGGSTVLLGLTDSRFTGSTVGSVTIVPNVSDIWFDLTKFDFSTLPQATSEPAIAVGAAWIDTTAGTNIVKVKLS